MVTQSTSESITENRTVVDTDVHQEWGSPDDVAKYLPERYRHYGIVSPNFMHRNPKTVAGGRASGMRDEFVELPDHQICATVDQLRDKHLDQNDVDYCILTGEAKLAMGSIPNRDYAIELARAYNEWMVEEWLDEDDRLLGGLMVAPTNPEGSADLIRDVGTDPRIVQVQFNGYGLHPLGHPSYWPIYEAADEVGLPIGLHPSLPGHGANFPSTGGGYEATYFEFMTNFPAAYTTHLSSLVAEGVFTEFPDLRFVVTELGYLWLPNLLWRMDDLWKTSRTEMPWVDTPPSELVLDRCRFTTQPMIVPDHVQHFHQLLEMIDAEHTLVYSSDFPHYDADDVNTLETYLPDEMLDRVLSENALEVYDLP